MEKKMYYAVELKNKMAEDAEKYADFFYEPKVRKAIKGAYIKGATHYYGEANKDGINLTIEETKVILCHLIDYRDTLKFKPVMLTILIQKLQEGII